MDARRQVHADNSGMASLSSGCWRIGDKQDKVFALVVGAGDAENIGVSRSSLQEQLQ